MGYYVYKYIEKDTNKIIYVGRSRSLKNRIQQHKYDKLKGTNCNVYYAPVNDDKESWQIEIDLINLYQPEKNSMGVKNPWIWRVIPINKERLESLEWHLYDKSTFIDLK